ncbi:MAG: PorV/PorQ family protein [Elusimicrobia bacterium]|nr:PorV/PorQ family protein [Elusimicrobiota bacterium]
MKRLSIIIISIIMFSSGWLTAGETTAAFLKLGSDAKSFGMGNVSAVIPNNINSIILNPAGLSSMKNKEISATFANLYADMRYGFIGIGLPIQKLDTGCGFGIQYLNSGEIEKRGIDRENFGNYSNKDLAVNIAYGRSFGNIYIGLNSKYITSRIEQEKADALVFDLGGIYKTKHRIDLGVTIKNLGSGLRYLDKKSPLPLTLTFGASYKLNVSLLLAVDLKNSIYENETTLSFGMEYLVLSAIALRTGYAAGNKLQISGLSGGFGISALKDYVLDYAFMPHNELGNIQKISFKLNF